MQRTDAVYIDTIHLLPLCFLIDEYTNCYVYTYLFLTPLEVDTLMMLLIME